jgi:hypothetical protein
MELELLENVTFTKKIYQKIYQIYQKIYQIYQKFNLPL